jgi:hypothetical protein
MLEAFKKDYYYMYLFRNDTIVQLSTNELLKYLTMVFDSKAKGLLNASDNNLTYWRNLKYWYTQGHASHIVTLI